MENHNLGFPYCTCSLNPSNLWLYHLNAHYLSPPCPRQSQKNENKPKLQNFQEICKVQHEKPNQNIDIKEQWYPSIQQNQRLENINNQMEPHYFYGNMAYQPNNSHVNPQFWNFNNFQNPQFFSYQQNPPTYDYNSFPLNFHETKGQQIIPLLNQQQFPLLQNDLQGLNIEQLNFSNFSKENKYEIKLNHSDEFEEGDVLAQLQNCQEMQNQQLLIKKDKRIKCMKNIKLQSEEQEKEQQQVYHSTSDRNLCSNTLKYFSKFVEKHEMAKQRIENLIKYHKIDNYSCERFLSEYRVKMKRCKSYIQPKFIKSLCMAKDGGFQIILRVLLRIFLKSQKSVFIAHCKKLSSKSKIQHLLTTRKLTKKILNKFSF